MWEALGYVTSGLTLVAFITAVGAYAFTLKSKQQEKLIKAAPENRRAQLVLNALEFFHVDTESLTKDQKFDIAIEQIRQRANRFRISAIMVVLLSVILAAVSAYAISRSAANADAPQAHSSLKEIVRDEPTSFARTNTSGSAVQLFEKGWMVADFQTNYFYVISRERPIQWRKIQEEYVKGVDPSCDDLNGESMLRLGFCWHYERDDLNGILGSPISKETRAWVQFQDFGDDLMIYGLPTTKVGVESEVFQTLAAIYLEGALNEFQGSGQYKLVNESTLPTNPYCSANWYPARKDRQLPQQLRELISDGRCQRAVGAEQFVSPGRTIRLQ